MLIRNSEIKELSEKIRKAIDGQKVEFRDNKEGSLSILKNDIHTLVNIKNEQLSAVEQEHALFIEFMENISHQLKTPVKMCIRDREICINNPSVYFIFYSASGISPAVNRFYTCLLYTSCEPPLTCLLVSVPNLASHAFSIILSTFLSIRKQK